MMLETEYVMALRDTPYMPVNVQDFLSDEKLANCSAESTGVYIRLMCILHKMEDYGSIRLREKDRGETPVKGFANMLSRQMPYSLEVVERSLQELLDEGVLVLEGETLSQPKMVRDGQISLARAEAGRKGGRTSGRKAGNDNVPTDEIAERFEVFWQAYPRKVGKGAARKAFLKIKPSQELLAKMLAALQDAEQSQQWIRDGGQFIPYPATWLNQERWDDTVTGPRYDPENPYADWGGGDV